MEMEMLTPEYIKQEAHKPVYWSEEIGFDVVSFTLAMEQNYSNRVGSMIDGLRKEIKQLTTERDKATQYWQIAEGRCDALQAWIDALMRIGD